MAKSKLDLQVRMGGACWPSVAYVRKHPSRSANVIGLECREPDWLAWFLGRQGVDLSKAEEQARARAVRGYAVKILERNGLRSWAEDYRVNTYESLKARWVLAPDCIKGICLFGALSPMGADDVFRDALRVAKAASCGAAEKRAQLKALRPLWTAWALGK